MAYKMTRYGVKDWLSILCRGTHPDIIWPTQNPTQWVPGLKRTEREADHTPASSSQVKPEHGSRAEHLYECSRP